MDERYAALSQPPKNALKPIEFGALKGKSDINPQWRIEALTEQFGLCGIGWKFEIDDITIQECPSGERLLYMRVNLYVKNGEEWSAAIPGMGGDYIIKKNKAGLVANDEAYKMCLTDALGNAAKCIGVAADIYRGNYDGSKYSCEPEAKEEKPKIEKPKIEKPKEVQHVRSVEGVTQVLGSTGWVTLASMTKEQLNWVVNNAVYKEAHDEARKLMMRGA